MAERVLPWKRAAFNTAGVATPQVARTRLFIGPVNSAGQGFAWARAAETLGDVAATSFMYRDRRDVFGYPADQVVDTVYFRTNSRWRAAQRRAVRRRYSHVIVESGRQLFGVEESTVDQVRELRAYGVNVALLWHGSDIRVPSRHARREPDSPFARGFADTSRLEEIALRNQELMRELQLPTFVSTPDLLIDVPGATWLPVVVDADSWSTAGSAAPMQRPRPVVVHAPSNAGLKGSDRITTVMRRLHDDGLVEYREARGIPASEMKAFYGDADIVLDQFSLGIYGVAACEAMAAGRVVISHVAAEVRDAVHRLTGDALPVLQARADELEAVLRRVLSEPAAARAAADAGRSFVRQHHNGARSAEALRPFLSAAS
ncbi:glycosyltransferase [Microbacterium sp.]|uniref:glycosyltransferase n=1 Tax=Microbacterium sp. TaxID=51671 RepID=UPI002810E6F4|nr:glycosyltransferase [Microbacterium sp.]